MRSLGFFTLGTAVGDATWAIGASIPTWQIILGAVLGIGLICFGNALSAAWR